MSKTRVVILAAGKGTRMKSELPKPLIPIHGKPMVARLVESVKSSGIDQKPVLVVGDWSKDLFVEQFGVSVDYAVQMEQLGTGHALQSAEKNLTGADHVVVLYGDHPFVSVETLRKLVKMYENAPEALVMLTTRVPNFEGKFSTFVSWSRILRDASGRVMADRQVKDATEEEKEILELNPCLFAFPAPWIWEKLAALKNNNANAEYYLTDVIAMAMEEGRGIETLEVDPMDVVGVNSPEELARAEEFFAE